MGERVMLYTDGACLGNPGPGGWGALLVTERDGEKHERELSGGEDDTTNNRMEIMAVLEGLKALKRPCEVEVVSDSQYVIKAMTEWMAGWKKKGWKTGAKKPVKNQDLWVQLDEAASRHRIKWTWVRGHTGHPENERVDDLAREEATRIQAGG